MEETGASKAEEIRAKVEELEETVSEEVKKLASESFHEAKDAFDSLKKGLGSLVHSSEEKVSEVESKADHVPEDAKDLVKEVDIENNITETASKLVSDVEIKGENLVQTAQDYLGDLEKKAEKLVPESEASTGEASSAVKGTEENQLPTSDKCPGESSAESVPREDDSKGEGDQPTTGNQSLATRARASWRNCCGLLDLLKSSDQ